MMTSEQIRAAIAGVLRAVERVPGSAREGTALPSSRGKVRDSFVLPGGRRVLVATDRVSAFDRVIGAIPFKGQVLSELSAWWFEATADIVPNHLLALVDPNVTLAREAEPLPVEVIVRGFITGVTSTSLWTLYSQGIERPYGLELSPGLQKNDPLPRPVLTPTTKAAAGAHDERLTPAEILERGLMPAETWAEVERIALALFARGQEVARRAGLLLVDTKYELGLIDGELALIDELHTPDSSRYWLADSYHAARAAGGVAEPEHFDKEHLRVWLKRQGYRGEGEPPELSTEIVVELASRYIALFERQTGRDFAPAPQPAGARVQKVLAQLLR